MTREELVAVIEAMWPLYLLAKAASQQFDPQHQTYSVSRYAFDDIMAPAIETIERLMP